MVNIYYSHIIAIVFAFPHILTHPISNLSLHIPIWIFGIRRAVGTFRTNNNHSNNELLVSYELVAFSFHSAVNNERLTFQYSKKKKRNMFGSFLILTW